mgnify:CR=1 FL=1
MSELRALSIDMLPQYCDDYRQFLINEIQLHGGHFSANLGTVELTVALHYVLNTPTDQLIWDVGHQSYLHKIITGRKNQFHTIRKKNGLSGFPSRSESEFDTFGTGHSSTSISAILGMAEADKLLGFKRQHVAVIGDGSLTGGMAWEALNNAAVSDTNVLIIINDNQMGIDPNAGALNQYLQDLKPNDNFFIDLGFDYFHTKDGHNVTELVSTLQSLIDINKPKIWHIKTVKGKGYQPAEDEQTKWHSVKYVKVGGDKKLHEGDKFQDVFGLTLLDLASKDKKVVGVTPAMPSGCSMKILMDAYPAQAFDVGIAEQHAVTFSAGLAANGLTPFCNIYSTFLQRGYDQVIHDVCLQNLPVIFCLDRAGVVGEDGATHHGLFDIAFLNCIPKVTIVAPSNEVELRNLMFSSISWNRPVAIRYPKGFGKLKHWRKDFDKIEFKQSKTINSGEDVCILAIGPMVDSALQVAEKLLTEGVSVEVIDVRFIKPLDDVRLHEVFAKFEIIITIEDGTLVGGFGSSILAFSNLNGYSSQITTLGFPDEFIGHATREELLEMYNLDSEGLFQTIKETIQPK